MTIFLSVLIGVLFIIFLFLPSKVRQKVIHYLVEEDYEPEIKKSETTSYEAYQDKKPDLKKEVVECLKGLSEILDSQMNISDDIITIAYSGGAFRIEINNNYYNLTIYDTWWDNLNLNNVSAYELKEKVNQCNKFYMGPIIQCTINEENNKIALHCKCEIEFDSIMKRYDIRKNEEMNCPDYVIPEPISMVGDLLAYCFIYIFTAHYEFKYYSTNKQETEEVAKKILGE